MQCEICLILYSDKRIPMSLPCGHSICDVCDRQLRQRECPICKTPYEKAIRNFSLVKCLQTKEAYDEIYTKGVFKIILIGDIDVGKTAFKYYLEHKKFNKNLKYTICADFGVIKLKKKNHVWTFNLWDTSGQERFKALGRTHYVKSDVVILIYNVSNPQSLQNLKNWIKDVKEMTPDSKLFMIGNKIDLDREVKQQQANNLSREVNAKHYLVSCKTGQNIERTWQKITDTLIDNFNPIIHQDIRQSSRLSKDRRKQQGNKGRCC